MSLRSMRPLLATMTVAAVGPLGLSAQNSEFSGRRVAVETACHPDAWGPCRTVRGTLSLHDSTVLVLDSSRTIPLARVRGMRYQDGKRHPTMEGLAIGGAIGMVAGGVIGAASVEPCRSCFLDFSELGGAMVGGFIGMVAGGLLGAGLASGMEVDRWRTVNERGLNRMGVPRRSIALGAAVGYVFPNTGSFNERPGGVGAIVRASLAPSRNVEHYAEFAARRVGGIDTVGTPFPPVDVGGRTVVSAFVGTKSWIGFLGVGRVLPYYAFGIGYESPSEPFGSTEIRSSMIAGVDVFSSSTSHVFVETRYVVERGGIGVFAGAKFRL